MTSFARSAPARPSRLRPPLRSPSAASADTETNDEKRKARYQRNSTGRARPSIASTGIRAEGGAHADQENRTSGTPRHARRRSAEPADGGLDRRAFLRRSGLAAGGLAALGALPLASVRKAEAGPAARRAGVTIRKNICTHCSVGCTVIAEVVERRVDRPGAGLGFARSTAARTAPRARRRASWCTAIAACAIR